MRIYYQQQCRIFPVTPSQSVEIIELSKSYYRLFRWLFVNGELQSDRCTLPHPALDEDHEQRVFQGFAKEVERRYPSIQQIKLQVYAVHEIPTSCFVLEKKVKHAKNDKYPPNPKTREMPISIDPFRVRFEKDLCLQQIRFLEHTIQDREEELRKLDALEATLTAFPQPFSPKDQNLQPERYLPAWSTKPRRKFMGLSILIGSILLAIYLVCVALMFAR